MQQLPVTPVLNKNVDDVAARNSVVELKNFFVNEFGSLEKRPGYEKFIALAAGSPSPVGGLYYWETKDALIAMIRNDSGTDSMFLVYRYGGSELITNSLPNTGKNWSFTDDGTYLFMCNGGSVYYFQISAINNRAQTSTYVAPTKLDDADSGAPTDAEHIIYYDDYLLVRKTTGQIIYFADRTTDTATYPSGFEFTSTGFFNANTQPDATVYLGTAWREILIFGKQSIEYWYNNGVAPFARLGNTVLDIGCGAAESVINADNGWFFLDDQRNIVFLLNKSPQVISNPIAQDLADMETVSDCVSSFFKTDENAFVIFTFPSAKRTYVYELRTKAWSQWTYFVGGEGHLNYKGYKHLYVPQWGRVFVGDLENNTIHTSTRNSVSDNGQAIVAEVRTPRIDYGTMNRKRSKELQIHCLRGIGIEDEQNPQNKNHAPKLSLKWRDDGYDTWSNERIIDLGKDQEALSVVRQYRMGMYKTRQYEISHSEKCQFQLVAVYEDAEELRR